MISRSFVVLEIVSLIALSANGHTNPFFICQRNRTMELYNITINQRDEIVLNNCTDTLIDEIIGHILYTNLRARPLRLHMSFVNLNNTSLQNAIDLDLSGNDLSYVDVQNFARLKVLNLTSNNIFSLRAIKLRRNITLTDLDVSRNRLLRLEHFSIPSTIRLSLRSNNIFEVDENVTLPESLLLLDLTRNEIENVSFVSLHSKSLQVLNLSINLINGISRVTFEHLPALETLILECNKIFEIEEGTFSRNSKLIELNLRDNNLSVLKKGVFDDLANLQVLDISKNDLLKLTPDTVQILNNLAVFSVSENLKLCDMECKHDLEFLLVLGGRLRDLKMDRLRLRQFPVMLTTSVRLLDLSKNYLKQIQQGVLENFPFLESLKLSGNAVEMVENEVFSRMEFLKILHLDNNKLKRVPVGLPQSLDELHLNNNRILSIENNDFYGLINLKVLKINSNLIRSVESGSFRFLKNLEMLDISENPIVTLSTDAFEGPINIKILHASGLKNIRINFTDVRYFPISEMPNLRNLNLSRSPELAKSFLTDIPLLATVKLLEILDLSYTNLTHIPSHLENFLLRLKSLVLLGNPLNCTNSWLRNWKRSYDFDVREFDQEYSGLKIRVSRKPLKPLYERVVIESRCQFPVVNVTFVPTNEFWSMVKTVNDRGVTNAPYKFRYENLTSITINNKFKSHESELIHLKNLSRYDGTRPEFVDFPNRDKTLDNVFIPHESTTTIFSSTRRAKSSTKKRKKLNSRSLHVAKFSNNDNLSFPMNTISSTEVLEILNVSRTFDNSKYSVSQINSTTSNPESTREIFNLGTNKATSKNSSNEKVLLLNVKSTEEVHLETFTISGRTTFPNNLNATSASLVRSIYDADEEIKREKKSMTFNYTLLRTTNLASAVTSKFSLFEQPLTSRSSDTWNFRNEKLPFTFSTDSRINSNVISQMETISTSNKGTLFPKTVLNISLSHEAKITHSPVTEFHINTYASGDEVLESFQSQLQNIHHESSKWNRSSDRVSFFDWFPALNESTDFTERAAALDDQILEYTHPGLVIFSAITCLLIIVFLSLIVSSCVQKYKWRRQRYRTSEFDDECQKSIEISSVSAFVETEISLE